MTIGKDRITAYRWLQNGDLPGIKLGKIWIIFRDEVRDYLASNHNQAEPAKNAHGSAEPAVGD